jgi:uncharacterized coiled-coil protein SlyX
MKMRYFIPTAFAAAMLAATPATPVHAASDDMSIEDVQKKTSAMIENIKDYGVEQRDKAVEEINDGLAYLDKRIDALEVRIEKEWDNMSEAARDTTTENLEALKQQRAEVSAWFGRLKTSSDETWEDVKEGVSNAYEELAEAWSDAEEELADNL